MGLLQLYIGKLRYVCDGIVTVMDSGTEDGDSMWRYISKAK